MCLSRTWCCFPLKRNRFAGDARPPTAHLATGCLSEGTLVQPPLSSFDVFFGTTAKWAQPAGTQPAKLAETLATKQSCTSHVLSLHDSVFSVVRSLSASLDVPVRSQWVGVSQSPLPASLFEHLSMGTAVRPPTQRNRTRDEKFVHSKYDVRALMPLYPGDHRMCVVAKGTGLST